MPDQEFNEPLPDSWRPNRGLHARLPACKFCKHEWHGLPCKMGYCTCNSAAELIHEEVEPDEYGRDIDTDQPKLPMVWDPNV